jgi:biopolymer transport protein ExbD
MSATADDQDGPIVGINVTPLVDVVLVLLVVLMVTAPLLSAQTLPLDLPKAATGTDQQTILAVELGADGRVAVDGAVLGNLDEIYPLARAARDEDPEVRVVLRADGAVPHERVVRAMDEIRRASIARIAFGVEAVGATREVSP